MSQMLAYDEIEMWHGHPDPNMNKLDEFPNTPDDSDIANSVEVDLKYPDDIKEKTKNFPFALENKIINDDKCKDYMKRVNLRVIQKLKN